MNDLVGFMVDPIFLAPERIYGASQTLGFVVKVAYFYAVVVKSLRR